MLKATSGGGSGASCCLCSAEMGEIGAVLHEMCQPLTTLQCRLEMAALLGTPEALGEGVREGLAECARVVEAVGTMREAIRRATQEPDGAAL